MTRAENQKRSPSYSSQFHRDVKRLQKRGKDLEKLKKLIELLLAGEPLPALYKDHPLKLNWAGYRDAHVEPEWVLIYSATAEKVHLERTGTHEELFESD
jgi:mRNA interferase YafQ